MKLYLAGPMRGQPLYNFPLFDAACVVLRDAGHYVLAPQEHDRDIGFKPEEGVDPNEEILTQMITWDIQAILDSEAIVLLHGWTQSAGSRIELIVAYATRKKLFTLHFEEKGYLRPLELHDFEITFKA